MQDNNSVAVEKDMISPEEYARALKGLKLVRIFLTDSKCRGDIHAVESAQERDIPISVSIEEDASYTVDQQVKQQIVSIMYKFKLKAKVKTKQVMVIEATFAMVFVSLKEFTPQFFEVFRNVALPYQIWPFFREFVSSTASRMEMPKLTLPLRKSIHD